MTAAPALLASELRAFQQARRVPGLVAGLVRSGAADAWGWGTVAGEGSPAPDAHTVFEVGSITKVFTATLLAHLAGQGTLALDAPIRPLLEPRVALPPWPEREVTPAHLATHTSTLPRASRRMMAKALRHPTNPYRDYQEPDLYADLAAFTPAAGLGRAFAYSNLGFGVLGHVLTLAAGRPFEDLVREHVCRPLGLADTVVTLDEDQRSRLARGRFFGRPVGLWEMSVLAGAGALRSTAQDLLRLLQCHLGLHATALDEVLRETTAPRLRASDALAIGLAWHRTPLEGGRGEAVWHRGETGGMRSFLGYVRERDLGLVLLANASAGVDELGLELLARL